MTVVWNAGDALPEKSIALTLRRSVQAVGATRDLYPVHHDVEFARASGAEGIFFNTMFLQAFVGRCVCEWFGNDAFLRRLEVAMRGSNYVGRTLRAQGEVTLFRDIDGCQLIDASVTLSTEDGPTTDVKISVQLPVAGLRAIPGVNER
jgi:acyl dehydratase